MVKRFIDCSVPVSICNFRCEYCYLSQTPHRIDATEKDEIGRSPRFIGKAFSMKRLGGRCLINLCGIGETLLSPNIVEIIKELLVQGHYVMVVTNGTITPKIEEILEIDEKIRKRLFFKLSFHYEQLKRLNLIDTYFNNVDKIKRKNVSFTVELVAYDAIEKEIDDIKKLCEMRLGAMCHVTAARNLNGRGKRSLQSKYSIQKYKSIWSEFHSALFDFKIRSFNRKIEEFCYAGDWGLTIDLKTGEVRQCYEGLVLQNIYKNINKPLKYLAVGNHCPSKYCRNAHAQLAFGFVPEIKNAPDFASERNRICIDGSQWLSEDFKKIFQGKLYESNKEYSQMKKWLVNVENYLIKRKRNG